MTAFHERIGSESIAGPLSVSVWYTIQHSSATLSDEREDVVAFDMYRAACTSMMSSMMSSQTRALFFDENNRGYPYWLRVYIHLKINEKKLAFSQEQVDTLVKKVVSMNSYLDIYKALVYTNKVLSEAEVIPASLMKTRAPRRDSSEVSSTRFSAACDGVRE